MGHLGQPHLQLKQWKDGPIEATEWGHIPLGQPSQKVSRARFIASFFSFGCA